MNIKKIKEIRATHPSDANKYYIEEKFECGKYTITKTVSNYTYGDCVSTNYRVTSKDERYLPRIYYSDWTSIDENTVPRFTIQTAAYGDLDPSEIRKLIKGYEEAIEVVETLTEEFIDQKGAKR